MIITKSPKHEVYGSITHNQSNSCWLLMTLVKYVHKKDEEHLLNAFNDHYKVKIDWTSRLYHEITLHWNY